MQVTDNQIVNLAAVLAEERAWREAWPVRALIATRHEHVGMVLLSVLANTFDLAMPVMLRIAFPGFTSIKPPLLFTCGTIGKSGQIMAGVVNRDQSLSRDVTLYNSVIELRDAFRRLADRLLLSDHERIDMFKCVSHWLRSDRRLDPTFDPRDPDAKRLVN